MRVYVASAFVNKEQVRCAQRTLMRAGHIVTYDWTESEIPENISLAECKRYLSGEAEKDVRGVETCEALVFIDHPSCKGAYSELGMAIALKKLIIAIGVNSTNLAGHLVPSGIFFLLHRGIGVGVKQVNLVNDIHGAVGIMADVESISSEP